MHQHVLGLADAQGAVRGLVLDSRVPPTVEMDDVRGCGRVQARASGLERKYEETHGFVFLESAHQILWQQDRKVPLGKVEMSPLISDRSLPFPLAPIVLLAAEPVKASLRRAQRRRAALTEPAASGSHFSDQEGVGSPESPPQGDVSTLLQRGTFLLCRDSRSRSLDPEEAVGVQSHNGSQECGVLRIDRGDSANGSAGGWLHP